jgi:hypothetical protein
VATRQRETDRLVAGPLAFNDSPPGKPVVEINSGHTIDTVADQQHDIRRRGEHAIATAAGRRAARRQLRAVVIEHSAQYHGSDSNDQNRSRCRCQSTSAESPRRDRDPYLSIQESVLERRSVSIELLLDVKHER